MDLARENDYDARSKKEGNTPFNLPLMCSHERGGTAAETKTLGGK